MSVKLICPIGHRKEENTMRITKNSLASMINLAKKFTVFR